MLRKSDVGRKSWHVWCQIMWTGLDSRGGDAERNPLAGLVGSSAFCLAVWAGAWRATLPRTFCLVSSSPLRVAVQLALVRPFLEPIATHRVAKSAPTEAFYQNFPGLVSLRGHRRLRTGLRYGLLGHEENCSNMTVMNDGRCTYSSSGRLVLRVWELRPRAGAM